MLIVYENIHDKPEKQKKYLTKLQYRNELIFKYMIFNFAAWQVTFLMIDFSLETTWSIYCFTAIQLVRRSQHLAMAATTGVDAHQHTSARVVAAITRCCDHPTNL